MIRLGHKIIIIGDKLEMNLPVGDYGYVIAYDRNPDSAFDYIIRVPKAGRQYYVTAADVEKEDVLLQREAEKVEKEALIDYALKTRNEELFHYIMNGPGNEEVGDNKSLNQNDFIKQIHLKAWI